MSRRLVALLLLALLGIALPARADDRPAPEPGAELKALVEELRPQVARLRGLPWKRPVDVSVLTRKELRAYTLAGLERDVTPAEWTRDTRIARRLGLLAPDEDLRKLVLLMHEEMVAGSYDPKTKQLVLAAGIEGRANIPTLVHELTHALEDQHYDLLAMEAPYRDADPDRQFAIRCIFEGSAELARRAFEVSHPDAARAFYRQRAADWRARRAQFRVLRTVPTHMLLATMLHYRAGPNFVAHAVGDDFAGGMRALLADPPVSQEQILHPERWLGAHRDHPRRVVWGADVAAALGPGWSKLFEHSVGEVDLAVFLDHFLGDADGRLNPRTLEVGRYIAEPAHRVARGWDAGRALYLQHGDGRIAVVHALAFDSEKDADEGARYLGAALRAESGEVWKGEGWAFDERRTEEKRFDYRGKHGLGRILHRGREVLVLDGVKDEEIVAGWNAVLATRFERDPRDRGDDMPGAFDDCMVVDAQRGLGLVLPDSSWSGEEGDGDPIVFATAHKQGVHVRFIVLDDPATTPVLERTARRLLGRQFDRKAVRPTRVMGQEGIQHPMGALPNQVRTMHIASDAARTYVVIVDGTPAAIAKLQADVKRLLDGMPGPGAQASDTEVAGPAAQPPAGLRSIPGF